jgi:hypothetical protein
MKQSIPIIQSHRDKMLQVRLQSLIDSFRLVISLRRERRRHNSPGAKQNCYFLPKRTRESRNTICNELTTQPMKTKDMVNIEFSKFLHRHLFLASHKVNQLSLVVSSSTKTRILLLPRLVLRSLTIKSKVTVCQGFSGIGNGCSSA